MKPLVFATYCKCFNVVNETKEFGDIHPLWNKKMTVINIYSPLNSNFRLRYYKGSERVSYVEF